MSSIRSDLRAFPALIAALAIGAPACAPQVSPPAATAESPPACPEDKKWDAIAKECRLYPGGGYGWAGCSQRESSGPPGGGTCITGTHWDHCDCAPDAPPPGKPL